MGRPALSLRPTENGKPHAAQRPGGCDACDANCDGSTDLVDIAPFIDLILGSGEPCAFCTGDTNDDGSIDLKDIENFISCLLG